MDTTPIETATNIVDDSATITGQPTSSTTEEAELPTQVLVTVPGSLCRNGPEQHDISLLTDVQLHELFTKCDALAKVNRVKIINATFTFASSRTAEHKALLNILLTEYQLAFDTIDTIRGVSDIDFLRDSVCHTVIIQKSENVTAQTPEPGTPVANATALPMVEGAKKATKRRLDDAHVVVSDDGFRKPSKHLVIKGNSGRRANNSKVSNNNVHTVNTMSNVNTVSKKSNSSVPPEVIVSNTNVKVSNNNNNAKNVLNAGKAGTGKTVSKAVTESSSDKVSQADASGSTESAVMDTADGGEEAGFRKTRVPAFHIVPPAHWARMLMAAKGVAPMLRSKLQGKFLKIVVDSVACRLF